MKLETQSTYDEAAAADSARCVRSRGGRRHSAVFPRAFTLVELLTVMAIIGVLAAFLLPTLSAVKRHSLIQRTQSELHQLETAIHSYHEAFGFYPPSNPKGSLTNQLYFELLGTTNENVAGGNFLTLDGSARIGGQHAKDVFGTYGFMNCDKPGAGETARPAQDFLPNVNPDQIYTLFTNGSPYEVVKILVGSVGWQGAASQAPLGSGAPTIDPWRYNSVNPTNNPGSYDLWIDISIRGKTFRISNWSRQPTIIP